MTDDPIWDDLWHGVIWSAFITVARECGGPPPSESVKKLAYSLYEAELRASQNSDSHDRRREGRNRR